MILQKGKGNSANLYSCTTGENERESERERKNEGEKRRNEDYSLCMCTWALVHVRVDLHFASKVT